MIEFTHEERVAAAAAVAAHTTASHLLREETRKMVAEAWASGEVSYCVSNQYAIQLQLELNAARKAQIAEMKRIEQGITNAVLDYTRLPLHPPGMPLEEGESREEFERDRMGQTGADNAKKMFGK